eukprot:5666562-Alexandrium_andersonii.AAC.1
MGQPPVWKFACDSSGPVVATWGQDKMTAHQPKKTQCVYDFGFVDPALRMATAQPLTYSQNAGRQASTQGRTPPIG